MSIPDPYKILQVDPEAEDEVIEAAYRRLARKYHPDVSPDPESQDRMVRINQAWELLRDPGRRSAVDRARARTAGSTALAAASEARGPAARTTADAPPPMSPPFSGTGDPGAGRSGPRPQYVSPDWTGGRSSAGGGYDPATMRSPDHAGPPPGRASGPVLNFGRYAGWSLGEIARADLEYLEWLDRMPIGRPYQSELDEILRSRGRRVTARPESTGHRGLFRRR
jgi:curved DNA-binding protein CbpA